MDCPDCNSEMYPYSVVCVGITTNDNEIVTPSLDIIIECEVCGMRMNGFLPVRELVKLEDQV